jgi:ribosomal protein L11 methyltransferase
MEWLEKNPPQSCTVLDYGCGSGILAMVASKLGASTVHGVDIDPQAIESARYNAERNACAVDYFLPEEFGTTYPDQRYDFLLANILASPLKLMAPMLYGRLNKQGKIVLSGVLARQAEEVIQAYQPFIQLAVWAEHEGWVALAGQSN